VFEFVPLCVCAFMFACVCVCECGAVGFLVRVFESVCIFPLDCMGASVSWVRVFVLPYTCVCVP